MAKHHSDVLPLRMVIRDHLMRVYALCEYNQTHAAQKLGISRYAFARLVKRYELKVPTDPVRAKEIAMNVFAITQHIDARGDD